MREPAHHPEATSEAAGPYPISDEEALERVLAGETEFYEILMHRHRRLLHYVARGIVRNDAEAEEVVQDAHLRAFVHLGQFAGRSSFSTWLTRITVNEALSRRRRPELQSPDFIPLAGSGLEGMLSCPHRNPEQRAFDREVERALQDAVDELPEHYRAVFTMREIDEMSTFEAARRLGISDACVKTRLLRARKLLREKFCRTTAAVKPALSHAA